ncbi:MAG: response regulator [Anaerolineae bacterium]|nr:response regulator [Anaerolineae bacterium]
MPTADEVIIVLVEDNPGHARLVEKNLRRANISNPLVKLGDGKRAIEYLFGPQGYITQEHPPALLMLLDLNLPVVDGYRVIEQMKSDARTKTIPIIVLTTTDDAQEVDRCYALGCNVYVTKPVDYEQFADAVGKLGLFLSVVKFPSGG